MRVRKLIVGLAAAAMMLGLAAGPASAAGEGPGVCVLEKMEAVEGGIEGFEEIVHLAEDEGDKDAKEQLAKIEGNFEKCLQSPSLIIPELTEIIWGGAAFAVLLGLMIWKLFPAVKKGMDERSAKIQGDLDAAERARLEAEQVRAQYDAELASARTEASRIVDEARQQADQVKTDLRSRAEADIAEMRTKAAADVDSAKTQAMSELKGEVSDIALGAAEMVIEQNLDRNTQVALIESYIERVGSGS